MRTQIKINDVADTVFNSNDTTFTKIWDSESGHYNHFIFKTLKGMMLSAKKISTKNSIIRTWNTEGIAKTEKF